MGYEIKLYIVAESKFVPLNNGKVHAQVICMFDMCKCYDLADVFKEKANGYIYAEDGNTKIEFDRYDEPLLVASLDEVMTALKPIREEYDRAEIAYELLRSIKEYKPHCKVYKYGH